MFAAAMSVRAFDTSPRCRSVSSATTPLAPTEKPLLRLFPASHVLEVRDDKSDLAIG